MVFLENQHFIFFGQISLAILTIVLYTYLMKVSDKRTVLVIDDDETVLAVLTGFLKLLGYEVLTAQNGDLGWDSFQNHQPDAILSDLLMPGNLDGLALLAKVRTVNPLLPFIIISGKSDVDEAMTAMRKGAWDFIVKPVSFEQLSTVLHRVWERASLLVMRRDYQAQLEAEIASRTAELHHRVKNNLQIILILLDLQRENTHNVEARELLWESQNRIHAMAEIQEQAFQEEHNGNVDLRPFLTGLVLHLVNSLGWSQVMTFEWDIPPLEIEAGSAFSIGLILNEIIAAVLETELPQPLQATLKVSLIAGAQHSFELTVEDSWGAIQTWQPERGSLSMSVTMLKVLTELVEGKLQYDRKNPHRLTVSIFQNTHTSLL